MPDNKLGQEVTEEAGTAQADRGGSLQTGPVEGPAYREIVESFADLGRLNTSQAASVRFILLAFARSHTVRREVRRALPLVMVDPAA